MLDMTGIPVVLPPRSLQLTDNETIQKVHENMKKDIIQIRKDVIAFIAQKIKEYGEPCYVKYYDFVLKHCDLNGSSGIKVSIKNGRVCLGDGEGYIDPNEGLFNLRELAVIAEAVADPENLSHEEEE